MFQSYSRNLEQLVTVLITFHQGWEYLPRLIELYRDSGLAIIILDSNQEKYNKSSLPENFRYLHMPQMNIGEKLLVGYKNVKTKYVVWSSHDDFVIKDGLLAAISFLEKNEAYSSVHGRTFVKYPNSVVYESFRKSITGRDLLARLVHQYKVGYDNNLFSVNRTSNMKHLYSNLMFNFKTPSYAFEFFHCFGMLVFGRLKVIDSLFLVREKPHGSAGEIHQDVLLDKNFNAEKLISYLCKNSDLCCNKVSDEIKNYLSKRKRKKISKKNHHYVLIKLMPRFVKKLLKIVLSKFALFKIKRKSNLSSQEYETLRRLIQRIDKNIESIT